MKNRIYQIRRAFQAVADNLQEIEQRRETDITKFWDKNLQRQAIYNAGFLALCCPEDSAMYKMAVDEFETKVNQGKRLRVLAAMLKLAETIEDHSDKEFTPAFRARFLETYDDFFKNRLGKNDKTFVNFLRQTSCLKIHFEYMSILPRQIKQKNFLLDEAAKLWRERYEAYDLLSADLAQEFLRKTQKKQIPAGTPLAEEIKNAVYESAHRPAVTH